MTLVCVARDAFRRSWPTLDPAKPIRPEDRVYALPLSEALERSYRTDAHLLPYTPTNGYRLNSTSFENGVAVEMPAIIFDLDGPGHAATPEWRADVRQKTCSLFDAHGPGFYYETRGGSRIVYLQKTPTVIRSQDDAQTWKQEYAIAIAYLKRKFGLLADPACSDWQRSYRLPRATREVGGLPENHPTFGDANAIGALVINATEEDVAAAKRASNVFRASRSSEPSTSDHDGMGLLYWALDLRGHVGRKASPRNSLPGGGHICLCPNRGEHTKNTDWTDATIVVPPQTGNEVGLIRCKHGHCSDRFTVAQWLRMFSDTELETARLRGGIAQKKAA